MILNLIGMDIRLRAGDGIIFVLAFRQIAGLVPIATVAAATATATATATQAFAITGFTHRLVRTQRTVGIGILDGFAIERGNRDIGLRRIQRHRTFALRQTLPITATAATTTTTAATALFVGPAFTVIGTMLVALAIALGTGRAFARRSFT